MLFKQSDAERYERFNFHLEDDLEFATDVLLAEPEERPVLLLSGKPGSGRSYFAEAVAHRARKRGVEAQAVLLDFRGLQKDAASEEIIERAVQDLADREDAKSWLASVNPIVQIGPSFAGLAIAAISLNLREQVEQLKRLKSQPWRDGRATPQQRLYYFIHSIAAQTSLLLYIRDLASLPMGFLSDLVFCEREIPRFALAFSVAPGESPRTDVNLGETRRVEMNALETLDVQQILDRNFDPNSFRETDDGVALSELARTLANLSGGLPGTLAFAAEQLVVEEHLALDAAGVWHWNGELPHPLRMTIYEHLDHRLEGVPAELRPHVDSFLELAAVCGRHVPVKLALSCLTENAEEIDDLMDALEILTDEGSHDPVFLEFAGTHPAFPEISLYEFASEWQARRLLDRLSNERVRARAAELAPLLSRRLAELGILSRAAGELLYRLAQQAGDELFAFFWAAELQWEDSPETLERVGEHLGDLLRQRKLRPELLWRVIKQSRNRWLAQRRFALIEAYRTQPDGVPHDNLAAMLEQRSSPLLRLGRYEEAFEDTCSGLRSVSVATTLEASLNLRQSEAFIGLERLDEAWKSAERADRIASALVGSTGELRGLTMYQLGVVARHQGRDDAARKYLKRSLEIKEAVLPEGHVSIATTLYELGVVARKEERYAEARAWLERSLKIHEVAMPEGHPSIASTLYELGVVARSQERYDEARAHLERSLAISEAALPERHPSIMFTLFETLRVALAQGSFDNAKEKSQRELDYCLAKYGSRHRCVATALYWLSKAQWGLGDRMTAIRQLKESIDIDSLELGDDHAWTVKSRKLLAEWEADGE